MLDVIVRLIKGGKTEEVMIRLPDITEGDEGKVLMVKNGAPVWAALPTNSDSLTLEDRTTGTSYSLFTDNGKLNMEEVSGGE